LDSHVRLGGLMFGYIYKTTNLLNDKQYIGKKQGVVDKNYYGSGKILQAALRKYGKDNFRVDILEYCETSHDLNQQEIYHIANSNPEYNIAKGGTGGNTLMYASKEHLEEVSKKRVASATRAYREMTIDQKQKRNAAISRAKKGRPNGHSGRKHSVEEIQKRRAAVMRTVQNATPEQKQKWRAAQVAGAANRVGVTNIHSQHPVQINGITYAGVIVAATELNVSRQTINSWIKKGKAKYE